MNPWTKMSIEFANQRNYLDELFRVYPCVPEGLRDINPEKWSLVETAFKAKDKVRLIDHLLALHLFPIKDSYVAYLRRDRSALARNPETVNRLCGRLFEMGLDTIYARCSEAKETNRQIGPLFARWIAKGSLGVPQLSLSDFTASQGNATLSGPDTQLLAFAQGELGYRGEKRPDLIARFNGTYVLAEAKFLTDFGGHQNVQLADAKCLLQDRTAKAVKVAILEGVCYIPGKHQMYMFLTRNRAKYNIVSTLVLREFLFQL